MKSVFLESHHIKNLFFGFGQFNYSLLKSLAKSNPTDFNFVLHTPDIEFAKKEFGDFYSYKKYYSLRRYPLFRIRKRYDLWHSMNQNTQIEPYHDLKYLLTVHNISHIKNPDNYRSEENHVRFQKKLDRSSAITYISKYAKESTHRFFEVPDVPEYVIYNGNTLSDATIPAGYRPQTDIPKPFLFTVGEITHRKNFISLVRMLGVMPDYHLVIAGKKSTEAAAEIEALAKKMNLENRVFLPGKISEADKIYYYQNCEAFVFPSLREGFGLPVIEAMRFQKPAIISDNTSLPEVGGDIAYYLKNFDPEYMAQSVNAAIEHFASDPSLGEESTRQAMMFNWNDAAKQYLTVYQSLLL